MPENNALARQFTLPSLMRFALPNIIMMVFLSMYTIVDGMKQSVRPGDVVTMSAGCKHTIHAETEMQIIEVQLGSEIDAADKTVFRLEEDV